MQVSEIATACLPAIPLALAAAWYVFVERVAFDKLGQVFEILDVLRWESDQTQAKYLERFAMTRFDWYSMKRRHIQRVKRDLGISDLAQAQHLTVLPSAGAGVSLKARRTR